MPSRRTIRWTAALVPLVLLAVLVAAWAIDAGIAADGVPRNVELAGEGIGGMSEVELVAAVDRIATEYQDTSITIESEDDTYRTTAGELGLSIAREPTVERALDVGRGQFMLTRPFSWFRSLFSTREAEPAFAVDEAKIQEAIVELEGDRRTAPIEPELVFSEDTLVAAPGEAGTGIQASVLAAAVTGAAEAEDVGPLSVSVRPGSIPPTVDDEAAEALAEDALDLTADPLTVSLGEHRAEIDPRTQRSWMSSEVDGGEIELSVDSDRIREVLTEVFADAGEPAVDASFVVEGGTPRVVPAQTGRSCCAESSGDRVLAALREGRSSVELELAETEPELTTAEAESLGIVAEVGSPGAFGPTTEHACCEGRVTNIHRIADIVRGAVIRPGETFSVNDHVGRRTAEKGFVAAGVIYGGEFTEDIGGGVSQFATTLFNAALYAGLDFVEYQSHSIYISRYPRGHEATLNYPNVDLEIANNTEHGVLIWPTYTDTSLTVHLYSTPNVSVEVGEPSPSPAGNCTVWTTPRTRTYEDGTVETDTVSATYRPAEGVDC